MTVIPFPTGQRGINHFRNNPVRFELRDGEPWFVAADVCRALDIKNTRDALSGLDEDERGVATTDTPGGPQQVGVINEAGLYSLILRSRKPEAKEFKRWVTHEVLPSIRKTGQYQVQELSRLELIELAREAELERLEEKKNRIAAELELAKATPKAQAWSQLVADDDRDYSFRTAAKILNRAGIDTGQNRLYRHLQGINWIFGGPGKWEPYQHVLDKGWLTMRLAQYQKADGSARAGKQCRITKAGLERLLELMAPRQLAQA